MACVSNVFPASEQSAEMQKGRKPSRHVQPGTKQQRLGVCMKKRSTFAALDITAFGIAFHATREVLQCKSKNTEAPKKGLGSGTESASKQRTHKMSMSVLSLNNCAYVAPHSGDNSYYPIPFPIKRESNGVRMTNKEGRKQNGDNKLYVVIFIFYLTPKHKKGRAVRAAQRGTTARSTERGAHAKAGVAECKT